MHVTLLEKSLTVAYDCCCAVVPLSPEVEELVAVLLEPIGTVMASTPLEVADDALVDGAGVH
eukprot:8908589-Pyramimonas_sp.AAC.1